MRKYIDIVEANTWHGSSSGSSESQYTDHTIDEATQYIKQNYPYYKTYQVLRADPGYKLGIIAGGRLVHPTKSNATEKDTEDNFNRVARQATQHTDSVDAALDQLNLTHNAMMSGSSQRTQSIGYSWSVHENTQSHIAVLYYQDRGFGNDSITIASKTRENLMGAVEVFKNSGVIPDTDTIRAIRAEKAAKRNEAIKKKGIKVGTFFGETPDRIWQVEAISPAGKIKVRKLATGETAIIGPGSVSKLYLKNGLIYQQNHKPE